MLKRLLLVAVDPAELASLQDMLTRDPAAWQVRMASNGAEAMAALNADPVDVIVTDFVMADMNGALLLNWVGEHHPKTLRIIMARTEAREEVMQWVLGQHHFLDKPVSPEVLHSTIQRALALDSWLLNDQLKDLVARIRTFPSLPSLYFQVMKELASADFSAQKVGDIIGQDLAMTTKLLQVLNSGFYGLARQVTDPSEAVHLLGQETIKSLIISIHIFSQCDQVKPLYFTINRVWQHSLQIAHAARLIAMAETQNADLGHDAYAAGLLHDIGKLVLANNFEDQYVQAQNQARRTGQLLWQVEAEIFGVSHAELGAYLLGRWGMPISMLEATALHHRPGRSGAKQFTLLTAVHAANALQTEMPPDSDGLTPAALDLAYLNDLGLADRVEVWKQTLQSGVAPASACPPEKPSPPGAVHPPQLVRLKPSRQGGPTKMVICVILAGVAGLLFWTCRLRPLPSAESPVRVVPPESPSISPRVVSTNTDPLPSPGPKALDAPTLANRHTNESSASNLPPVDSSAAPLPTNTPPGDGR
jgi:putative nucleotidyltransferase with HDIG domain